MGLYIAMATKTFGLANNQILEKGMQVSFSCIMPPWSDNAGKPINDAFLRVYGIDLKANSVLSPGFIEVKQVG